MAFIALWWLMPRGCDSPASVGGLSLVLRLIPFGLAFVAIIFASNSIDYWTVMRFFGRAGHGCPRRFWNDQVFFARLCRFTSSISLLFATPRVVFVLAILCALVFWATAPDGSWR